MTRYIDLDWDRLDGDTLDGDRLGGRYTKGLPHLLKTLSLTHTLLGYKDRRCRHGRRGGYLDG